MRIFITGANRGIGAEMVKQYSETDATVIGTTRAGKDGLVPLDVTNTASLCAAVDSVKDPIDLLICNAGVFLDRGQELKDGFGPDLWADTFAANVTGVFLTVQAMLPKLRDGSKIAIIASQMGSSQKAGGDNFIYRASKAAAINLASNLAVSLKDRNIAVGIYHPGWVITDMGGQNAAVTVETSVEGLIKRFDHLSLATTGCFENYTGEAMML
jgi:NAD(P)-dependent dehydrogenase (short-subunit alcohol dehydrogenase family)